MSLKSLKNINGYQQRSRQHCINVNSNINNSRHLIIEANKPDGWKECLGCNINSKYISSPKMQYKIRVILHKYMLEVYNCDHIRLQKKDVSEMMKRILKEIQKLNIFERTIYRLKLQYLAKCIREGKLSTYIA